MKFRSYLIWLTAIVVTFGAIIFQRFTGPANPKRITVFISPQSEFHFKLPRSQAGMKDARIELPVPDSSITGTLYFKRYPTVESWKKTRMFMDKGNLVGLLPNQPPAGKLEYYIILHAGGQKISIPGDESVIIRFRGDVPALIIIPHILFMFVALFLANLAGLMALTRDPRFRPYTFVTTAALLLGGMILGPVVQFYAFGELWTGFPRGFDLTDNKTLIAFTFWIIAFAGNMKKERPILTIIAAVIMLVIFSIPHSAIGSELDYETGKVMTGMVK
ncbi:MAG: hypothetical protein JW973_09620 [Bacteroidales bacterium]|nr:hypothetical protein [Bacteroidales bacterium]